MAASIFFSFARNKRGFFHKISVILNYCKVSFFQDFEISSKCLLYGSIARMFEKNVEIVYKLCVDEKQSCLKMSLERDWDRTAALTGVSRATAQRILSKKVELSSPLIDQAPTVTKVTLDD